MIKTFEIIRDAYSGSCCVCGKPFQETLAEQYELDKYNVILISMPDKDYVTFNQDSGKIVDLAITETANTKHLMSLGVSQPSSLVGPPRIKYSIYDGVFVVGHTVCCNDCFMYHYTLQIFINLNDRLVTKAILNSEFVTINYKNEEDVYEIKNIYTTEKTEYTHISKEIPKKTLVLPLVSNNMNNPNEVLDRIKNLLVFS